MVQPAGTPEGDGYDAAALVQAVEFHLTMFPSLKAEVNAGMLALPAVQSAAQNQHVVACFAPASQ